MVIEDLFILLR